ncbi:hypothetical protein hmeg3_07460 [Herbaspirillum sp. meg3]|uniref:MobV family relaxase n=1 Tax=Herbaspirillum sp. meg3 TaxID=2025949 RepID=UPI000B994973|nr:MobV family relaxase [Herbaspirillum sp. meg3]ASU38153.1 hypothetical protein hmeg3_07460 [Herbaspirillum sp. meg3]
MTTNFAVLTPIRKLKTVRDIGGAGAHNDRSRPPLNARTVQGRSLQPRVLHGPPISRELVRYVREKIYPLARRKDAVLAVEQIMSASPGYFGQDWREGDPHVEIWVEKAAQWAKATHGDNLISLVLHLDETNPHIHMVFVPLIEGRLCCKDYTSRKRLIGWQTSYANSMSNFGLERGIPASVSKVKATSLQDFYRVLNAPLRDAPEEPKLAPYPTRPRLSIFRPESVMIEHEAKCQQIAVANQVLISNWKEEQRNWLFAVSAHAKQAKISEMLRNQLFKALKDQEQLVSKRGEELAKIALAPHKDKLDEHSLVKSENEVLKATVDSLRTKAVALDKEKMMLAKNLAQMIKKEHAVKLAHLMEVSLVGGKADIFDALLRDGRAENFYEAVVQVTERINIRDGIDLYEIAEWIGDYQQANSGEG